MKRLLEYAVADDTIVVSRFDRLGLPLTDVLKTLALLLGRGVQVRSISGGIDSTTSTGLVVYARNPCRV